MNTSHTNRRALLRHAGAYAAVALAFGANFAAAKQSAAKTVQVLDVFKDAYCGCCAAWAEHMVEAGFAVNQIDTEALAEKKRALKVPERLSSCHTGVIAGYFIEGHVPASSVRKLLATRPDALGLAVPGMPANSPGMGPAVGKPFDVLLVRKDGTTEVFARWPEVA